MSYAVTKKPGYLRKFPSSETGKTLYKPSGGELLTVDDCGQFENTALNKTYLPVSCAGAGEEKLWIHQSYVLPIDSHIAAALKAAENVLDTNQKSKLIAWYNSTDSGKSDPKPSGEAFCTVGALWAIAQGTDLGDLISRTAAKLESKARNRGIWYSKDSTYEPEPGDLVLYKAATKTKASHTELLTAKNGNTIYTINFNSDSIVRRVKRSTTGAYLYGYVHIEY